MSDSLMCHCAHTYQDHIVSNDRGAHEGFPGKCLVEGCDCESYCSETKARAECSVVGCLCTDRLVLRLVCPGHLECLVLEKL